MLPHKRARLLAKLADIIEARGEEFARTQMLENGKVLAECRAQAGSAAATFRYYAAVCETLGSEVTPSRGQYLSMTVYEPYGVVAAITPWNSPLTMEAQKVAPALAAGNAVILKPSEVTPSAGLALGQAALDAGIPAGILNVLPGTGAVAGDALVRHPGVKFVSFTGGTASGRRIAAIAAEKLMPVALELGGKSPHIVFADANLEAAAAAVADGIFEAGGQSCVAGSRLFVQRAAYERVLGLVVERARTLKIDLPDAPGAQFGPLSSFAHRERVERYVASARSAGGTIAIGGARPEERRLAGGAFYAPTVVAGLTNADSVCQQEIFGPVLCALPFDDEDDLVSAGERLGLWTGGRDLDRRLPARVASRPRARSRHGLDQHLQAAVHRHTVRRLQGQRRRAREGHRRTAPVPAGEEPVLGSGRAALQRIDAAAARDVAAREMPVAGLPPLAQNASQAFEASLSRQSHRASRGCSCRL